MNAVILSSQAAGDRVWFKNSFGIQFSAMLGADVKCPLRIDNLFNIGKLIYQQKKLENFSSLILSSRSYNYLLDTIHIFSVCK